MSILHVEGIYKSFDKLSPSKEIAEKIFNFIFTDSINLSNEIRDILYFDSPYNSVRETKII